MGALGAMGENESKTCPTCQKVWALSFRFCPDDGTPLLVVPASADPRGELPLTRPKGRKSAERLMDLPPVTGADLGLENLAPTPAPTPTTRDKARPGGAGAAGAVPTPTAAPVPTIKKELVAPRSEPTRRHGRPTTDQPVVPQVEQRPQRLVKGGSAARPERPRGVDAGRTLAETPTPASLHELRTAPTLLMTPAVSAELIAQHAQNARAAQAQSKDQTVVNTKSPTQPPVAKANRAPAEQPEAPTTAPAPSPVPARQAAAAERPRGGKRKVTGGFSETDWFLAPIDPSLVDAKTGKVAVDPERYKRNPAVPDDKRRRFSLGGDDEE